MGGPSPLSFDYSRQVSGVLNSHLSPCENSFGTDFFFWPFLNLVCVKCDFSPFFWRIDSGREQGKVPFLPVLQCKCLTYGPETGRLTKKKVKIKIK